MQLMIEDFIVSYKTKLYFHVKNESSSSLNSGMTQGISQFMSNFCTEKLEIVRGIKFTFHILIPEPQLLLILKVVNASTSASDDHLKAFIKRAWDWYVLLHGQSISRSKCTAFFTRYLLYAGRQLSIFTSLPSNHIPVKE